MSFVASPGPTISKPNKVFIFDLDETVLTVNSFPLWVKYMLAGEFHGLTLFERSRLAIEAMLILMKRKILKSLRHSEMKSQYQLIWQRALSRDPHKFALHNFIRTLVLHTQPNLIPLLSQMREEKAVLATAAACEYAIELGKNLGFSNVLATQSPLQGQVYQENIGKAKRDKVLSFLEEKSWSGMRKVFFTDHADDLALIQECDLVFWYGEKPFSHTAPGVTVVNAIDISSAEILAYCQQE